MPPPSLLPGSITLFNSWFCPYGQRVLAALHAKQVPFNLHEISYEELYQQNKPRWLLDLNPEGQVPFLALVPPAAAAAGANPITTTTSSSSSSSGSSGSKVVFPAHVSFSKPWFATTATVAAAAAAAAAVVPAGTAVIRESLVCMDFLDEAFPSPPMLPPDPIGRAAARMAIQHIDGVVLPALKQVWATPHVKPDREREAAAAALDEALTRMLELFEPSKVFALSDNLTLVDCTIGPHLLRLPLMFHYSGYKFRGPAEAADRLLKYRRALNKHAAIAASMYHPEGQDFMEALKGMYAHYAVSMVYKNRAPLW